MRRLSGPWLPIFHVAKGVPYHVENSISGGLNRAAAGGYGAIDLDWQLTEPAHQCQQCDEAGIAVCLGHAVNTHWLRPLLMDGFHDPERHIGRKWRVDEMSLSEVLRLRTRTGYTIHTAQTMFSAAAERGLRVAAELKHGRFSNQPIMDRLKDDQEATGCKVRVMKLSDGARPLATLKAAKRSGFETIVIARDHIPDSWRPFVDFARGPARFWR